MVSLSTVFVPQAEAVQVYPRIFSPNGDGWNDEVLFEFLNPAILPLNGEMFDVNGAKVGELVPGPRVDTLLWDGKRGGEVVPSGIYIYQVEVGGKVETGSVILVN